MKKKMQIFEIFNNKQATSSIQKDVLDAAGPELKAVPGLKTLVSSFESAYLQILKTIDKSPSLILSQEQEVQLENLIRNFASGLPYLFSMATAVSASQNRKPEIVIHNFKKEKVNSLLFQAELFAKNTPKINISALQNVYSDANIQSAIENIFLMNSTQLTNLVYGSNLPEQIKTNLLGKINKYKNAIDQQVIKSKTQPEIEDGPEIEVIDHEQEAPNSTELKGIISNNFKLYMGKIKEKFGKGGLQAMKQALDQEMQQI
jgi:hypothetical protein